MKKSLRQFGLLFTSLLGAAMGWAQSYPNAYVQVCSNDTAMGTVSISTPSGWSGSGTVSSPYSRSCATNPATSVAVTATPRSNYKFVRWEIPTMSMSYSSTGWADTYSYPGAGYTIQYSSATGRDWLIKESTTAISLTFTATYFFVPPSYDIAPGGSIVAVFAPSTIPTRFSLNQTSFTYNGSAQGPSVVASPGNASFTTGGTLSATNAGPYTATATATGIYTGSDSMGWTINKANQSMSFGNPGPQKYGFPVTLSAGASSKLPTTFSVVAGSATLSDYAAGTGGTYTVKVTATAQGNVTIRAAQAGDGNYNPVSADNTFVFNNTGPTNVTLTLSGAALTTGAQGETALYLGDSLTVSSTIHDDDGNLTIHNLSVSSDGAITFAPLPGTNSTPSNGTDSSKSAVFTPTKPGRWDFNAIGTDGLIWPTGVSKTLWVYGTTNNATVSAYTIKGVANATLVAVAPGQSIPVSITLRNTGDRPWTTDTHPHKLVTALAGWGTDTVALPVTTVFPNSEATFTFTVTAPATAGSYAQQWQMAEYFSTSPTLFGSTVPCSILVAPLPAATITATANSGVEKTANGGGSIVTYVGDTVSVSSKATATGWLSEHNIFGYTGTTTPAGNTMLAGGGLAAASSLASHDLTCTSSATAQGTYTLYTEAFTGSKALERANGTSGYPGYLDGAANKRITVQVRRSPTATLQILNAAKQPIAADANGRIPLEAGTQFYARVTASDPDGSLSKLYLRYTPNGGATVSPEVAATGATASSDFGPYAVTQTGVCAIWAHASDDHCAAWGGVTPWDGNKLGWATIGSNGIIISDTTAPSVPAGLTATNLASTSFTLGWTASTDNSAVAGYKIFSNGTQIGTSTTTTFAVTGLAEDAPYLMQVSAYDAAGKESAKSAPGVTVTTPLDPNGDKDGDQMPNKWESDRGFDPKNAADAQTDFDGDGWTNVAEYKRGSDPKVADANTSYPGNPGDLTAPRIDLDQPAGPVVGSTVGSLSVGKTGEASYNIPLWVVPGTSGMEPKLSLNYSSQGGPGMAGYGWSLGGLSAITRGPLTKLVDGQIKAVQLTAADAYYMDGQRLLVVSGTNGAAASEYRTQMESFTKVVAQNSTGTGPQWFKAWTKAGLVIEFGNPATTNSRVLSDQVTTAVLSWSVTKITDIAGNYMTFSYDWDATNREQRLSRIDYTGNSAATLATFASVEFTYEDRPDPRIGYAAGSKSSQLKRLKQIISRGPDGIAKTYTLGYTTQPLTDFSLLDSLTEADAAGKAYNPLRFAYAQHNAANMTWGAAPQFAPPKAVSSKKFAADVGTGFLDINGDGWTDFVGHRIWGGGSFDFKGVWLGSPTGWVEQPANSLWQLPNPLARENDGDQGARFVDLNGDGLVDFVWSLRDGSSKGAYLNTGSGWQAAPQWNPPDYFVYSQTKTGAAQFADINGDGLPDLVVARYGVDSNRNGVYLNTGSGWTTLQTSWALKAYLWAKDLDDTGARLVDLNGDGLPDLIQGRYTETGAWANSGQAQKAWLNTGSGWVESAGYKPLMPLAREKYPLWGAEFTDLNGDGLVDFVVNHFNGVTNYIETYLNTGRGWSQVPAGSPYRSPWSLACNNNSGSGTRARSGSAMVDLNQDGLPDEIWKRAWDGTPAGSPQHGMALMTSSGFSAAVYETAPLQLDFFFLVYEGRDGVGGQFVDVNADGAPDFVWNHNGDNVPPGYPASGAYLNQTPRPNLLKTVTNGLGVKAEIVYTTLTARDSAGNFTVYDRGSSAASPTSRVGVGPMTVVQTLMHDDGTRGTYNLTYRYGTLRSHPLYGSLGFRDVTVVDSRTNVTQLTQYSQATEPTATGGLTYPYLGMPVYTETKQGTAILSQGYVDYATKEFTQANGKKTLLPIAISSISYSFDSNGAKLTDTTTWGNTAWYDNYGNVTHLEVEHRDVDAARTLLAKVVTDNTYFDTAASLTTWRLGRLQRSSVTHSRAGQTNVVRTSSFTYAESNTGMLESETVEPDKGAALKVTTTRTRDSYGNVTQVTTSTTDPLTSAAVTRTAKTQYDTKGRFPLWTENALGHRETYTYHQNLGLKLSLTGPNGLMTQWGYDTFGRIQYEARPDRTTTRTIHSWDAINGWAYTIFTDTWYRVNSDNANTVDFLRDHRHGPPSQVYYDTFGRARLARGLNGDGKRVCVSTTYDNQGRVTSTTQPYFEGAATTYSATTEFDSLGRPWKVRTPMDDPAGGTAVLNSLTTYTYDGLHSYTVVQSPEQASSHQKTRRKDSWTNALGQTVTVVDNYDKGATSTEYGKVTYSHDAIGNVAATTVYKQNGSSYTTSFVYDLRGRKTGMGDPNMGVWSYEYDALGQLRRQTDNKAQSVTMTYDALGRMLTRTRPETIPSARTVTTEWTYDTAPGAAKGKLAKLATYSGSAATVNFDYYVESYTYDAWGRAATIKRIIYDENSGTDLDADSPASTRAYSFGFVYDDSWDDNVVNAGRGHGQLRYLVYPFGYKVEYFYTKLGLLKEIRRADGMSVGSDGSHTDLGGIYNRTLWQAAKDMSGRTIDEYGRALAAKLGNGIDLVWERPTAGGGVRKIQATLGGQVVRRFDYAYDGFQNVRTRTDQLVDLAGATQTQTENFTYDALQRLTSWQISGQSAKTATYDSLGNITNKSDVGAYTYAGTAPNAATTIAGRTFVYDANGNCIDDGLRQIRWTAANQVQRIVRGTATAEFFFDAADQRVRQKSNSGTTIYVGGLFERFVATGNTAVEHRFYVITPTGRAVLHTEDGSAANGKDQYFVGDALGSISSVYDHLGRHVETRRYDPWGVQTKVFSSTSTLNVNATTRGFTDHEMLDGVGLIHMNGRVYDPVLGRFLSADPYVDDATDANAFNRYSYVHNDPLGSTDPSGYFSLKNFLGLEALLPGLGLAHLNKFGLAPWNSDPLYYAFPKTYAQYAPTIAGIVASVVVGYFCGPVAGGAAGGFVSSFYGSLINGGAVGDAFRAGVVGAAYGAATAVLSAGIGRAFGPSGSFANEVGRATAHGVVGGAIAEMQGGEFRHGFISSAASSFIMHSGPAARAFGSAGDGNVSGIVRRTMLAAAIGGTVASISGGKFANGAITAAFQHLFNAEAHFQKNDVDEYTFMDGVKDALSGAAMGAAAFVDGIIPFADPLENQFHLYDSKEYGLSYSKSIGGYTRDVVMAIGTAGGTAEAQTAARFGVQVAEQNVVKNNVFRWGVGSFKNKGVWLRDKLHFHLGPGPGPMKQHLPFQAQTWRHHAWATIRNWWN